MFSRVVKYLDLRKANRDETLVTRPFTLARARVIKKINTVYNFELINYPSSTSDFWDIKFPQILAQWNVSAEDDFRILNVADFSDINFLLTFWNMADIAIKYRIGNEVTRYFLKPIIKANGQPVFSLATINWPWYGPRYNGETIRKNFSIELWQIQKAVVNPSVYGFVTDNWDPNYNPRLKFRLVTSMIRNPTFAEETEHLIEVPVTLGLSDMYVPFDPFLDVPVTFPIEKPNVAWLDNA